ncbi:MAG: hypothetical protein IKW80_01620, partial [Thermoguttaceae bacterium]|nr:hypothetical protein [Thermoguttaceae bacterium]
LLFINNYKSTRNIAEFSKICRKKRKKEYLRTLTAVAKNAKPETEEQFGEQKLLVCIKST